MSRENSIGSRRIAEPHETRRTVLIVGGLWLGWLTLASLTVLLWPAWRPTTWIGWAGVAFAPPIWLATEGVGELFDRWLSRRFPSDPRTKRTPAASGALVVVLGLGILLLLVWLQG